MEKKCKACGIKFKVLDILKDEVLYCDKCFQKRLDRIEAMKEAEEEKMKKILGDAYVPPKEKRKKAI